MIRFASVLLLVVALATCPFRCMGALEAAMPSGETVARCSCCRPPAVASSPAAIDQPSGHCGENACDGCDCLCEGAVVGPHLSAPSVDVGAGVVLFEAAAPAMVRVQVVARSHDFWNDLDPSGRTLRVLRQSFQL